MLTLASLQLSLRFNLTNKLNLPLTIILLWIFFSMHAVEELDQYRLSACTIFISATIILLWLR